LQAKIGRTLAWKIPRQQQVEQIGGQQPAFDADSAVASVVARAGRAGAAGSDPSRESEEGWLPLALVTPQGSVAGSRAFRAPLRRDRLAVRGRGRGENKPKAHQP